MRFYTVFISFQEHYSAQNYMKTPAILELLWLFFLYLLLIKEEIILKNMWWFVDTVGLIVLSKCLPNN